MNQFPFTDFILSLQKMDSISKDELKSQLRLTLKGEVFQLLEKEMQCAVAAATEQLLKDPHIEHDGTKGSPDLWRGVVLGIRSASGLLERLIEIVESETKSKELRHARNANRARAGGHAAS